MAQTLKFLQQSTSRQILVADNLAVSVAATGNTDLLIIPCLGLDRIMVEFAVTVQALDAFIIQAKATMAAAFVTLYSVTTDYTSPKGLLIGASGDLTLQGAGTTGWFIMEVSGLTEIKVQASANVAGAATVSIYAGGS